jgi:O-antigen/teichoic acid export membrane protein
VAKERRTLRIWLGIVVLMAVSGAALLGLLAEPICALLLGPAFGGAAVLLPWIGAAYAMQAIQHTFEVMLYAHGETHRLVMLQVFGASTSVVLYLLLIPRYAAMGAALATLGAFFVSAVLAFFFAGAPRRLGLTRA